MINIPELELAWMAGFFDGEGCFSLGFYTNNKTKTKYFKRRVCVVNTDIDCINIFKNYFGGIIVVRKVNKNQKTIFAWSLSSKQSGDFCRLIIPYLKLKKSRAELYLKFDNEVNNFDLSGRPLKDIFNKKCFSDYRDSMNNRINFVEEMKVLNKRGL